MIRCLMITTNLNNNTISLPVEGAQWGPLQDQESWQLIACWGACPLGSSMAKGSGLMPGHPLPRGSPHPACGQGGGQG